MARVYFDSHGTIPANNFIKIVCIAINMNINKVQCYGHIASQMRLIYNSVVIIVMRYVIIITFVVVKLLSIEKNASLVYNDRTLDLNNRQMCSFTPKYPKTRLLYLLHSSQHRITILIKI